MAHAATEVIMLLGVPKEIKVREYRVGLVPSSVREVVANGHEVIVETGAGEGIGMTDDAYRAAGASIVDTASEIFERAEMIIKVKEPQAVERKQLSEGQILFTYLHLAPDPDQANDLIASGATCIAYETVTSPSGGLPLLAPMSEVAGRLSIQAGAYSLRRPTAGSACCSVACPASIRPRSSCSAAVSSERTRSTSRSAWAPMSG
jgi:alanine dehydrogenase